METFDIYKSEDGRITRVRENVVGSNMANFICKIYNFLFRSSGSYYYYK